MVLFSYKTEKCCIFLSFEQQGRSKICQFANDVNNGIGDAGIT